MLYLLRIKIRIMKEKIDLIAVYMGYTILYNGYTKKGTNIFINKLPFNTDWNLLMPVIEKIAKTPNIPHGGYFPRTFGMIDDEGLFMFRFNLHALYHSDKLIIAAFDAVVEYIESL